MTRNVPDLILERYLLKELPEASARAVEQMLAADPALRARLDAIDRSDLEIRARYSPLIGVHDIRAPSRRLVLRAALGGAIVAAAIVAAIVLPLTFSAPAETE